MTTMDFFESQARALRRTGLLVFLFCVAVFLIILTVHLVVCAALPFVFGARMEGGFLAFAFHPKVFAAVAGSVIIIVVGGTIYKIFELRQGGSAVAFLLGGIPVSPDTIDPDERKLMNVVEEMSIASGCPIPAVFVQHRERSINAFAAGFSPTDAAVCVTRGAIHHLNRDELQGVIAHEFSHIVNGDMRLNIKLIGVLHGILQIALLGGVLMRIGAVSDSGRRGRDRGGAAIQILLLGAVLFAIGYIGLFFGKLIKAAVSRQREFLADAAAVQYTRNPSGIAGALRKIGGLSSGSSIMAAHAEEASHMFFGNGLIRGLSFDGGLLSTHPPIPARVKRIDPTFDGTFPRVEELVLPGDLRVVDQRPPAPPRPPPVRPVSHPAMAMPPMLPPGAGAPGPMSSPAAAVVTATAILAQAGQIRPDKVTYARQLLDAIPPELKARLQRTGGAQAVIYAILLREDLVFQQQGLEARRRSIPQEVLYEVTQSLEPLKSLDRRFLLPLVDLAVATLRTLPAAEATPFLASIRSLIKADSRTTLFEFAVEKILSKQLDPEVRMVTRRGAQYYSLKPILGHVNVLLSALSQCGGGDASWRAGIEAIGPPAQGLQRLGPAICNLEAVQRAFDVLTQTAPDIKRRVFDACTRTVTADNRIGFEEAELLRAVAESLDIPMPPVVTG